MRKKIALALTSLLMLTALLTTPYFTMSATSGPSPQGIWHWKIMLAQKGCNAWISGFLTSGGVPLPGTNFNLTCICGLPEPQPLGQFVYWKVATDVEPDDIHYTKYIDVNKDGTWDEPGVDVVEIRDDPIPYDPEPPHTVYQHVEVGEGPFGPWMVVVEVREQPYDPDRPFFEWQLKIKQHNANVLWVGNLTDELGDAIPGTDFSILCNDTTLQVYVVQTEYCHVPQDIWFDIFIWSKAEPPFQYPPIDDQHHHLVITQFPWKMHKEGIDPYTGDKWTVDLELTEVQMHLYWTMGGWTTTAGYLGPNPVWNTTGWKVGDGVPFATRAPWLTPYLDTMYITFTQRDPITGIVEINVPAEGYKGLDHTWYSFDVGTWFRSTIVLEEAGCGWIFTGQGKDPLYGSVDTLTYNNWTGVYTYGPDQIPKTADDQLLAGTIPGAGPGGIPGSAGAGPPIGPCLQQLRGPDGILGTGDDPIGRGDPDGPDGNGSSLLFLPATNYVRWWDDTPKIWKILYTSPWPQLYTTGTANDTIIEPQTKPKLQNATAEATGEPWEFLAGEDHKVEGYKVHWKHEKCNAYATYANAWSVLFTDTELGQNDVLFVTRQKIVRDDCVIGDVDCNELVDIMDILVAGMSFGGEDEYVGPDGIPMTPDDKKWATPGYDARADISADRGLIDIMDILVMAMDFGGQLTPACIVYPW